MKISTSLFFDRTVDQMINTQTNLADNQTKLSTGKNVVNPSGLRPDRRGRERFVDREHSAH